jgi:hypothetical protein
MPKDFYDMDLAYGSIEELQDVLGLLHDNGLFAILEIVLHQNMGYQQKQGTIFYDDVEAPFDEV